MRFTEEDKREYLVVTLISLGLFLVWALSPVGIIVHEGSHAASCLLQGGNYISKNVPDGQKTVCKGVNQWTGQDALNFYLAGMGGEVTIGLVFFIAPFFSILGSLILFNFWWNLVSGGYVFDITHASKVFPQISLLQNPVIQIVIFIVIALMFCLSFLYTKKMLNAFDLPLVD